MRKIFRCLPLVLLTCFSTSLFATVYTFTGNGAWANQANWTGGIVPSGDLKIGDTILINGNALTTNVCDEFSCTNDIEGNGGTIIIAADASLNIRNPTQFSNDGTIIVYGTLINETTWQGFPSQNISIYGTFINRYSFGNYGSITVNEGGTIQNESGFGNFMDEYLGKGIITLNYGGTIKNLGSFTPGFLTNNGGTIINTGTVGFTCDITGDFGTNAGTISPGSTSEFSSSMMIAFNISGDYTATSTAVHKFKIAGTAEGSYDALNVGGIVTLDGTLNVSLVDGFVPTTNHDIPIVKGIITGKFATVNIPSRYTLIYNTNSVVLRSIPLIAVAFTNFTVDGVDNTASLSWSVENEQNAQKYEVERTSDGYVYTTIGTVSASNAGEYHFVDAQPQLTNFYRIKCVHTDGLYQYSSLKAFINTTTINTFNGEGNWSDATKWSAGTVPNALSGGQRIAINGTCNFDLNEFTNYGEVVVLENSTLNLNRGTFYNFYKFIVKGTVYNKADDFENNGYIQIFGTFINASLFHNNTLEVIVEPGGKFINTVADTYTSGGIVVDANAAFINKGNIAGNVIINGNVENYGTLAPGNSPGTIQVNGNYTATPTAIHSFEVSGVATGAYDVLKVTGQVNLNGTLNVSLIDGFIPGTSHELPIITGTISGTFSKVNIPPSYTLVYSSTAVILKTEKALPVTFILFDVKNGASGRDLNWKVGAEINVKGYEIERSIGRNPFQRIGFVPADGKQVYAFTDADPVQDIVYYRIKNIDNDGGFSYSKIVSIRSSTTVIQLKAFPNPVQGNTVMLQHKPATPGSVITLCTQDGKTFKQVIPGVGSMQTSLDLSGLTSGLYLARFQDEQGKVEILKIIK